MCSCFCYMCRKPETPLDHSYKQGRIKRQFERCRNAHAEVMQQLLSQPASQKAESQGPSASVVPNSLTLLALIAQNNEATRPKSMKEARSRQQRENESTGVTLGRTETRANSVSLRFRGQRELINASNIDSSVSLRSNKQRVDRDWDVSTNRI